MTCFLIILHFYILYVKTMHCKCRVFLPKWDNKRRENMIIEED
ncbi:hypothetical protein [Candidatus Tisiphia endosymbiont of Parasteatoda lunata]